MTLKVITTSFKGQQLRVIEVPADGLLLNTVDVCSILRIKERPSGTDIGASSVDPVTATNLACGRSDEFGEWLIETFDGYSLQTLVRPICDDSWSTFSS